MPTNNPTTLLDVASMFITAQRGPACSSWLDGAAESLRQADDPLATSLRVAFAKASRSLGDEPLAPTLEQIEVIGPPLAAYLGPHWRLVDVGRAALLLTAFEIAPSDRRGAAYGRLLRRGDLSEQESLLRMLPLLPDGDTLVEFAVDACRTNATPVFAALALDNAFAALHFSDLAFNQMVLKAVFLGLPIARVLGLESRSSAELARMVLGYASERRAAGRSTPAGTEFIVSLVSTDSNTSNNSSS